VSRGSLLPDPTALLPYALLAGGAWFLLKPVAGGASLVQQFGNALSGANAAIAGVGNNPQGPDNPTNSGAANGAGDTFNINTGQGVSYVRYVMGQPAGARVAFGHVGNGGPFLVILWAQAAGMFGIGAGDPIQIQQQTVNVGHDGQWTGYGVDFNNIGASGMWASANFWADIRSLDGSQLYNQAALGQIA